MGLNLDPWLKQLSIVDKRGNSIRLDPNWTPVQRQLVDTVTTAYDEGRPCRILNLKARQLGCSTVGCGIGFSWTTLFPNTSAYIVAHTAGSTGYLFEKTRYFYDTWPLRHHYPTRYATRREMVFSSNGSFIRVQTARNPDALRGRTIRFFHGSEVALWERQEEAMQAVNKGIPTVPGTVVILESTAAGLGNWFERTWREAEAGQNDYTPIFAPWFTHHEYIPCHGQNCRVGNCEVCSKASLFRPRDEEERRLAGLGCDLAHLAWRRWALPNLCFNSEDYFRQEFPACVVGGTRVGTNLGLIRIEEAEEATHGTLGPLIKTHQQPESPVYRMQTRLGYELTGTWDHPIFSRSGVLVPLKASMGCEIKLQPPRFADDYYVHRWGDYGVDHAITINEDWGRFLGLFMADGSVGRTSPKSGRASNVISIACDAQDLDVVEEVERLFKSVFGLPAHRKQIRGCIEVRLFSKGAVEVLDELGLLRRNGSGRPRRKVHVPEFIFRSPLSVVREFLRGWFEGDGFNGYATPRVSVFCKQEQALQDLQLLLLAFGITCRRNHRETVNGSGRPYVERTLALRGAEALKYRTEIGFLSERKQSRFSERSKMGRPMTEITLIDEVVVVEAAGTAVSYDFTIEGGEAFDANGILTHNTADEAFLTSGVGVFPQIWLDRIFEKVRPAVGRLTDQGFTLDPQGPLRIYKPPSQDLEWGRYFIGADPSFGTIDGDFAAACVLNRQTKEQVAVWHGRINPLAFADELVKLGRWYHDAVISCEANGPGQGTIGRLAGLYPNLWHHRLMDRIPSRQRSQTVLGFETNWRRKQWLITQLADAVERGDITLHDYPTYNELRNYSFYGDKGDMFGPSDPANHDDLVMALGIAVVCERVESPIPPYETRPGPRGTDQKVVFGERVDLEEILSESWA